MPQAPHASRELSALASALPVPLLILSPDFSVFAASDAYLQGMAVTREEIVGRPIAECLAGSDSMAALMASLDIVVRTGVAHKMVPGLFRVAVGNVATHQTLLEIVNTPLDFGAGERPWIVHSLAGVDERPRAGGELKDHLALQAAEARLRSIMRTVPDAMVIIDERGRIESLSSTAERLFGYSMAEVAGRNISLFMPSPHRERHDDYLERYLRTGERHIIGIGRIVAGQRKDGSTFPMHLTIGELRSAERHYFTGFIRDLTDQQMTESRLKELQSEVTHMSRFTALGEMASTLAHEINQPLTAIGNYLKGCHRMLERIEGEQIPVLRDALAKAAEQALRAGQIIQRLREFVARGESERQIESLPKLIEDASTLALIGAKEKGVSVSFRLDPRADLVLADRIQIQQVLVNLVRNAIEVLSDHAGPRALEISTSLTADDMVQIEVSDTGPGLASDVAARLFQPFVTTKATGMGLGLSICRTIVEAHGGRIGVEARPGGGTIFRFTLPGASDLEEPSDA